MTRRPVVAGNWKMELSYKASTETASAIKKLLHNIKIDSDVVLCPAFPVLPLVHEVIANTEKLALGAQNVHWEEKGAFTGEVSVTQLKSLVAWCIVGHSERRELVGETDEQVQRKANLLLRHGITPIICIGETAAERGADQTMQKLMQQMQSILSNMTRVSMSKIVIAYEPIWAVGTGVQPDPNDVTQVVVLLRKLTTEHFGAETAERLRILYGGSVKPDNVEPFMAEPGIDGVLVGGASVHPMDFVNIVKSVQAAHSE